MKPSIDVLLVSVDSLRADHLPLHGYGRETAPFFTSFVEEGTYFQNAFSTAGFTLGSVTSFLTSTYPLEFGGYGPLSPQRPSLQEAYQRTGRKTALIHENGWLTKEYQFDRGFDTYIDLFYSSAPQDRFRRWASDRLDHSSVFYRALSGIDSFASGTVASLSQGESKGGTSQMASPPDNDASVVDHAKQILSQDEPSFVWAHLMGPHSPYYPPKEYRGSFGDEISRSTMDTLTTTLNEDPTALTDEQIQQLINLYDSEIRRTDDNLRRLIEDVDLDTTLVAVVADHGDLFDERGGRFLHGPWMYDELLHVPMLIAGPGVPQRRIEPQVSLIDLAPTLLEASGDGDQIPKAFRGEDVLTEPDDGAVYACSAHEGTQVTDLNWSSRRLMVRDPPWKLVRHGTKNGYDDTWYDVSGDTETPAAEPGPDQLRDLISEFESEQSVGVEQVEQEPSNEMTERLRDLGYLK